MDRRRERTRLGAVTRPEGRVMSIRLRCPTCSLILAVPTSAAGQTSVCPSCERTFIVPLIPPTVQQWQGQQPPGSPLPQPTWVQPPPRGPAPPITSFNKAHAPPPPTPASYPEAFVWWQDQNKGRTFPFRCPGCGVTVELRQRVTQTRRTCPGCGFRIDPAAIDRQLDALEPRRRSRGCLGGILIVVAIAAAIPAVALW